MPASQTLPFSGQNEVVGIYQISIANEGKKEAEAVHCVIRISNATIREKRVDANASITTSQIATNDTLVLDLSNLNPQERIQISLLAAAPKELPLRPEVSLRAKGITGSITSELNGKKNNGFSIASAILGVLAGVLAAGALLDKNKKKAKEIAPAYEQRHVLAYLCLINGFNEEAERFVRRDNTTVFWVECDRLTALAIASKSKDVCERTKRLLIGLTTHEGIAEYSISIALLNAAKIDWSLENFPQAKNLADTALAKSKKTVESRVALEPELKQIFDFKS